MNGYDRIKNALNGIKPDKIPIMLHNFMMASMEAGFSQAEYRSDPKKIVKTFVDAIEKYEYDGIIIDIDTVTLADAAGVPVDFPENEPARSHEGMLNHISEVDQLTPINLENHKRVNVLLESVRLLKEHFRKEVLIRGNCDQAPFSLACSMRSPQNWLMDLMDENNRDRVLYLLEYCTIISCQMVNLMVQAGADMVSSGDSPAGPSMISPSMYREFAFPYEKRCVEEAHKHGVPYVLHICGDTTLILEDMVKTKVDALEIDYMTNIEKAHMVCRDKACVIGNIDPTGVLALGTVEVVRSKTEELISIFADSPRFILNAGCAIPQTTPSQNLITMIDTARSYAY